MCALLITVTQSVRYMRNAVNILVGKPEGKGSDGIFSRHLSRSAVGLTQPPIQWVQDVLPPGVKRPWREADHSHLVPRLRMREIMHPLFQCVFRAWCLGRHRDKNLKGRGHLEGLGIDGEVILELNLWK